MFGHQDDRGREQRARAVRALKVIARALLGATDDDTIVVNELRCTEPGCPPLETVVALLRQGEAPRQLKVHRALLDVTEDDVRAALAGDGHRHGGDPA